MSVLPTCFDLMEWRWENEDSTALNSPHIFGRLQADQRLDFLAPDAVGSEANILFFAFSFAVAVNLIMWA